MAKPFFVRQYMEKQGQSTFHFCGMNQYKNTAGHLYPALVPKHGEYGTTFFSPSDTQTSTTNSINPLVTGHHLTNSTDYGTST